MRTIFVLIVMGMLSGCVSYGQMISSERWPNRKGSFTKPSVGISLRRAEEDQRLYELWMADLKSGFCEGRDVKIIAERSQAGVIGTVYDFECEKAESAKAPSASP